MELTKGRSAEQITLILTLALTLPLALTLALARTRSAEQIAQRLRGESAPLVATTALVDKGWLGNTPAKSAMPREAWLLEVVRRKTADQTSHSPR